MKAYSALRLKRILLALSPRHLWRPCAIDGAIVVAVVATAAAGLTVGAVLTAVAYGIGDEWTNVDQ